MHLRPGAYCEGNQPCLDLLDDYCLSLMEGVL